MNTIQLQLVTGTSIAVGPDAREIAKTLDGRDPGIDALARLQDLELVAIAPGTPRALRAIVGLSALRDLRLVGLRGVSQLALAEILSGFSGTLCKLTVMRGNTLTDVDWLRNFAVLEYLNLSKCANLVDIRGLAELAKLHTLYVTLCRRVQSLRPLAGCTALTVLEAGGVVAEDPDLTYLVGLRKLTSVKLGSGWPADEVDRLRRARPDVSIDA